MPPFIGKTNPGNTFVGYYPDEEHRTTAARDSAIAAVVAAAPANPPASADWLRYRITCDEAPYSGAQEPCSFKVWGWRSEEDILRGLPKQIAGFNRGHLI